MSGLSITLEIARQTLLNEQVLIQTSTHNIANAENPFFARQRVRLETDLPYRTQAGWVGGGARVENITQYRDQYIEEQLMESISRESDYRTRSSFLALAGSYIEDDGETGISADLGAFWDAWDALSQNPGGTVEKNGVITASKTLAETLRTGYADLDALEQKARGQAGDIVKKANLLLQDIASYNQQITSFEVTGKPANDLRDQRYQALTELSKLVDINYTQETNGSITIRMQDGTNSIELVSNQHAGELAYSGTTNLVSYTDASGNPVTPAVNNITGGSLSGTLSSVGSIAGYKSELNTLATALTTQVNTVHSSTPVFSATSAADIAVTPAFQDPANVNGGSAAAVADLQDAPVTALGGARFVEYIGQIQQGIGLDQESALSRADFAQSLSLELQAQQQSVSGVSIDEEMISLLQYQQVYQAAAKVVSVTNELLHSVIDMV